MGAGWSSPNLLLPLVLGLLGFAGEGLRGFPFILTPSFKICPVVAGGFLSRYCDPHAHGSDASLPASTWMLVVRAVCLAGMLQSCSDRRAPWAS